MIEIQRIKIGANRLGPLHMHDPRNRARGQAGPQFGHRAAQLEGALAGAFHPQKMPGHCQRHRLRRRVPDQIGQGQVIGGHVHHRLVIRGVMRLGRGDVDGKEATRKGPGAHARQVQMPLAVARQPDRLAVGGGVQQAQQEIVVAIEDKVGCGHVRRPGGLGRADSLPRLSADHGYRVRLPRAPAAGRASVLPRPGHAASPAAVRTYAPPPPDHG